MSLFGIRVGFTAEYMTSFATNNKNEILFIPIINADFPSYFKHDKLCTKSRTLWSDCGPQYQSGERPGNFHCHVDCVLTPALAGTGGTLGLYLHHTV